MSDRQTFTREYAVATFVVHQGRVLLLWHPRLAMWLPPGGHVDHPELPDEAAVREVAEETGLRVVLTSQPAFPELAAPRQLARPEGIQLEQIGPGHEHIDLVYFARLTPGGPIEPAFEDGITAGGWYALDELAALGVNDEVRRWCTRAMAAAGDGRATG